MPQNKYNVYQSPEVPMSSTLPIFKHVLLQPKKNMKSMMLHNISSNRHVWKSGARQVHCPGIDYDFVEQNDLLR